MMQMLYIYIIIHYIAYMDYIYIFVYIYKNVCIVYKYTYVYIISRKRYMIRCLAHLSSAQINRMDFTCSWPIMPPIHYPLISIRIKEDFCMFDFVLQFFLWVLQHKSLKYKIIYSDSNALKLVQLRSVSRYLVQQSELESTDFLSHPVIHWFQILGKS